MASERLAVVFIVVTLTLDAIGFGLIMPVMPGLLREVTGGDLSRAALWGGLLTSGFAVMQFIFGPVIGNLSDRFGRKPLLLASLSVLTGDYIVLALAGSIWVVFAARLVTGAASSTYGTAIAYLSDISTSEQKAQRFGLIGAAFGAGFVLGPAIGGALAEFGLRAPFIAAAIVAGINMVLGAWVMRESLTPDRRRPFEMARANPFQAFRYIAQFPRLGRYLGIYFTHEFGFMVYPIIFSYFAIARFGWTPGLVGLSLAFYGVSYAVVQGALIGPALKRFGRYRAMLIGLAASVLSFAFMSWVASGFWALVLIPFASLGGLTMPALRAELSDRVPETQQGELQGLLASLRAVAMIIAPFVYSRVFAAFTGTEAYADLPGAVFIIAGALNLVALILLLRGRNEALSG